MDWQRTLESLPFLGSISVFDDHSIQSWFRSIHNKHAWVTTPFVSQIPFLLAFSKIRMKKRLQMPELFKKMLHVSSDIGDFCCYPVIFWGLFHCRQYFRIPKKHKQYFMVHVVTGWWFQTFFIFTPTWGRFPFWLIFVRWVGSTTNQSCFMSFQGLVLNAAFV